MYFIINIFQSKLAYWIAVKEFENVEYSAVEIKGGISDQIKVITKELCY